MKKTKILSIIVFIIIFFSVFSISTVNTVKATAEYVLAYHWATDGANSVCTTSHPSSGASIISGCSESFNISATVYITRVQVALKKAGSPTGTIYCQLNNNLSTGMPNEELAVSTTTVNAASLTTSWVNYTFYFNSSYLQLNASNWYAFSLTGIGSFDAANNVQIMAKSGGSTYIGEPGYYRYPGWQVVSAGSDLSFYIWGDTDLVVDATALTYTYTVVDSDLIDVWPTFEDWAFQIDINQSRTYHYNGQLWNNSMPWVNGTFYVWKTPLDNIAKENAIYDMLIQNMTLNYSAPLVNGWVPWLNISMVQVPGGGTYYQGMRINFTVTGTEETYTSDLLLIFHSQPNSCKRNL